MEKCSWGQRLQQAYMKPVKEQSLVKTAALPAPTEPE